MDKLALNCLKTCLFSAYNRDVESKQIVMMGSYREIITKTPHTLKFVMRSCHMDDGEPVIVSQKMKNILIINNIVMIGKIITFFL